MEVKGNMAVRLGEWNGDGFEQTELHWPGKAGEYQMGKYRSG